MGARPRTAQTAPGTAILPAGGSHRPKIRPPPHQRSSQPRRRRAEVHTIPLCSGGGAGAESRQASSGHIPPNRAIFQPRNVNPYPPMGSGEIVNPGATGGVLCAFKGEMSDAFSIRQPATASGAGHGDDQGGGDVGPSIPLGERAGREARAGAEGRCTLRPRPCLTHALARTHTRMYTHACVYIPPPGKGAGGLSVCMYVCTVSRPRDKM